MGDTSRQILTRGGNFYKSCPAIEGAASRGSELPAQQLSQPRLPGQSLVGVLWGSGSQTLVYAGTRWDPVQCRTPHGTSGVCVETAGPQAAEALRLFVPRLIWVTPHKNKSSHTNKNISKLQLGA